MAEQQNNIKAAKGYWRQALEVLSGIEKRALHLSPDDRRLLEWLRQKVSETSNTHSS